MNEEHTRMTERLARGLGWVSLGLGLAQLSAPRAVAVATGLHDSATARAVLPAVGARELVSAAPLLTAASPAPWVWTRVAGDATDLTLLGLALRARAGRRRRRTAAAVAVACITAVDLYTVGRSVQDQARSGRGPTLHLHAAVTVNRPRSEVYGAWRDIENLPQFMGHLESVHATGNGRSHWVAKGPLNRTVEWDAEIREDRPGELIAWRALDGPLPETSGRVSFADASGGRGTEVRVDLRRTAPGGRAGAAFARLLGEHPEQQVRDDLRRFKQYLETGQVVRSEGSPEGTRALRQLRQRPAQPAAAGAG